MTDLMKKFQLTDGFLGHYQKLAKDVVIPYQERVLHDQVEGAEKSHAIENFRAAAQMLREGKVDEEFYGMVFQDSDIYKWLEAAAYSLHHYPDPELEAHCDEIVEMLGSAQHPDGYINTYFTVKEPDKRWVNLQEGHELYCAGHLIEAAVAYADITGKKRILDITLKFVDHIYDYFVTQGIAGVPGHPEIELALMRLYHFAERQEDLELAVHFIDERGLDSDYFVKERQKNPWTVWGADAQDKAYTQVHLPVREQTEAVGHAVRAAYLYTGMADAALVTGDESLKQACQTLWHNITERKMYVTGAIGSVYEGEAFSSSWHLPNDTAYAEGCASIALIFFARQMLELELNSKYADVMERALYNTVLADMQLDGTRFFYVNPLESVPGISGVAKSHLHALPVRPKWFACACCPPNVARLLSSLGKYAWSVKDTTVYSHLFIDGKLDLRASHGAKIIVDSEQPYGGKVSYRFEADNKSAPMTLAVRMPEWSAHTEIALNGSQIEYRTENGYALIERSFADGDEIIVSLDLSIRRIYTNDKVSANSGRTAFARGALIYCAEGVDNNGAVLDLFVDRNLSYTETEHEQLPGVIKLTVTGYRSVGGDSLYSYERPLLERQMIDLVPYYTWSNRGATQMRVWLPEA
ncbi:MAG: glycoside hydrolase family 127 protein [Clostridiaceae bacterium]|nr:glycoside hydrolase family 127 protein [Clostridiaceae bacterium]